MSDLKIYMCCFIWYVMFFGTYHLVDQYDQQRPLDSRRMSNLLRFSLPCKFIVRWVRRGLLFFGLIFVAILVVAVFKSDSAFFRVIKGAFYFTFITGNLVSLAMPIVVVLGFLEARAQRVRRRELFPVLQKYNWSDFPVVLELRRSWLIFGSRRAITKDGIFKVNIDKYLEAHDTNYCLVPISGSSTGNKWYMPNHCVVTQHHFDYAKKLLSGTDNDAD